MANKRSYIYAREAEAEMQEARERENITGKTEKVIISNLIKNAKANSRIGDKLLVVIDPKYIHIPAWQRRLRLARTYVIGNNYNKYKWEAPKILLNDGQLIVIDGQHRIFGAFKAGLDGVVCEVMECSLPEAVELFLDQTKDRGGMVPADMYAAAIVAGKDDYTKLRDICHKHNVAVKGEPMVENTVGMLTSISDGLNLIHINPDLLDSILGLLGRLEWNGYADSYNGKAYMSKVIRVMKMMYAYYAGRTEEMEEILIDKCKGTHFFVANLMNKSQDKLFDYLSDTVRCEMESPFRQENRKKITCKMKTAA